MTPGGGDALEEIFIGDDDPEAVDEKVGFEARGEAEVDVAQAVRIQAEVALPGSGDGEGDSVDEGDVDGKAIARR
ncbi:MAG: hypothetical protein SFV54_00135 [Bryobacteraceae bacterium]|nr:hypothetical protein [Bryobacteraceae bacterium]